MEIKALKSFLDEKLLNRGLSAFCESNINEVEFRKIFREMTLQEFSELQENVELVFNGENFNSIEGYCLARDEESPGYLKRHYIFLLENIEKYKRIYRDNLEFIRERTDDRCVLLYSRFCSLTINQFKNISRPASGKFKHVKDWSKSQDYALVKDIDEILPGFLDKASVGLFVDTVKDQQYLSEISQVNSLQQLDVMCEIVNKDYSNILPYYSGGFLKNYIEELCPTLIFSKNLQRELGIEHIEMSIQDPSRKQENSYDAILYNKEKEPFYKVECITVYDGTAGQDKAERFALATTGFVDYQNSFSRPEDAKEFLSEYSQTPSVATVWDEDRLRVQVLGKLKDAFDKKNNKELYLENKDSLLLLITYDLKREFELELTSSQYEELKEYISERNQCFGKGVYWQIYGKTRKISE